MIVSELIEQLKQMPQEVPVVIEQGSAGNVTDVIHITDVNGQDLVILSDHE